LIFIGRNGSKDGPKGNLGGEACRFYLKGEPEEEFSLSAEINIALIARYHVTDYITFE
jgi:hypothetical protein